MTYQHMHVRRKSEESKMNANYMQTFTCSTCKLNSSCETQKKIAELRGWEYIGGCTKYMEEPMAWDDYVQNTATPTIITMKHKTCTSQP